MSKHFQENMQRLKEILEIADKIARDYHQNIQEALEKLNNANEEDGLLVNEGQNNDLKVGDLVRVNIDKPDLYYRVTDIKQIDGSYSDISLSLELTEEPLNIVMKECYLTKI